MGFGLERKQRALQDYVEQTQAFRHERWDDEVVSLERGRADVYDISVEETHRYCAGGFVNHNSYWHTRLMTERIVTDRGVVAHAAPTRPRVAPRPAASLLDLELQKFWFANPPP